MSDKRASYEKWLERTTGKSMAHLRDTPLDQQRLETERTHGFAMRFVSTFPFIGRGNVLRDRTVSHEEAEQAFTHAIR